MEVPEDLSATKRKRDDNDNETESGGSPLLVESDDEDLYSAPADTAPAAVISSPVVGPAAALPLAESDDDADDSQAAPAGTVSLKDIVRSIAMLEWATEYVDDLEWDDELCALIAKQGNHQRLNYAVNRGAISGKAMLTAAAGIGGAAQVEQWLLPGLRS